MSHHDCTCCRHWRVVEQLSHLDVEERLHEEALGKIRRLPLLPLLPLLPPAPIRAAAPLVRV